MWKHALVVFVLAAGCGGDEKNDSSGGSGGAVGTGGAPATGTGGAPGTGGAAMLPMCPAEPGPATCGTETCPAISGSLAMACIKSCCTPEGRCGTRNAFLDMSNAQCAPPFENTSMCPDEMIMGNMVPGCCVMGSNDCGVIDILTGSGMCVSRTSPILAILAPGLGARNCDGTTPMGTAGMTGGTGGMGTGGTGTGGMGTGGMGTGGTGTGGTGTGGMMGTGGM